MVVHRKSIKRLYDVKLSTQESIDYILIPKPSKEEISTWQFWITNSGIQRAK